LPERSPRAASSCLVRRFPMRAVALAELAAVFFRHRRDQAPDRRRDPYHGKTTAPPTARLRVRPGGLPVRRIGTIGYRVGLVEHESARTTPEAPDIQRMLAGDGRRECLACAMRCPRTRLVLRASTGCGSPAALFTNLTRDHLDFHGRNGDYFLAKRRLSDALSPGRRPSSTSTTRTGRGSSATSRRPSPSG